MAVRYFSDRDHFVVSKPGFNADSPSLQHGDKLFDSNWLFGGTVVGAGLHIDVSAYKKAKAVTPPGAATPYVRHNETTDDSTTQYIDFGPLSYVPTVTLIPLADSRYWADHGKVLLGADPITYLARPSEYHRTGEITVTNDRITIPRCYSTAGGWYYREDFLYLIMAM